MTEKEAWLLLATTFNQNENFYTLETECGKNRDLIFSQLVHCNVSGLCMTIFLLYDYYHIDKNIMLNMINKIKQERERINGNSFLWGFTYEEDQKRVAFCKLQAELLEETCKI